MSFEFTTEQVGKVYRMFTTRQQVALDAKAHAQGRGVMEVLRDDLNSYFEGAETMIPLTVQKGLDWLANQLGIEHEHEEEEVGPVTAKILEAIEQDEEVLADVVDIQDYLEKNDGDS